jgi:hypothetical protein
MALSRANWRLDFETAGFIRRMVNDAGIHHLSLFSTAEISSYAKQALPVNRTPPTTALLKPAAGSVLHGKVFLVASASSNFGISELQFELRHARRNVIRH